MGSKHASAITDGWHDGQTAGAAIADVLFGNYHPSDRLPGAVTVGIVLLTLLWLQPQGAMFIDYTVVADQK